MFMLYISIRILIKIKKNRTYSEAIKKWGSLNEIGGLFGLFGDLSVIQHTYLFQTQKSKRFNTNALTQLVKRLYYRVGVVGASSHSGRRTFITKLATSGVSVRVIAEAVGHASIATTQRYIDVNDELISNAVELV